jgi:PBP1b-binding outer membrane lipoprotein LpoB
MNKFLTVTFLIVFISGCYNDKTIALPIKKIKDTSFIIPNKSKNSTILSISINGYSNDSVIINNIKLPGGNLDTTLKMDWYKDTIIINFKKFKASKGDLILKCKTL